MISLVTGKIGSGKTLHSVGLITSHIAKGGTVYTNVDLVWPELVKWVRIHHRVIPEEAQLNRIDLVDDDSWHKLIAWGTADLPVLVVLDEIHLFFNARDWQKTQTLHRSMLSFLSQSRKACVDVVFIAQVATTLEKQFRVQCEWEFYCRNVKDIVIPIFGKLPFCFMLLVKKDVETDKAVERRFISYDKSLFPVYDTRAFLDAEMRQAAESANVVPPLKLRKVPLVPVRVRWAALAALVLTAAFVYFT